MSISRSIYLIVYNSRPFKAHWALWIPNQIDQNFGKALHVTGDVRNGFEFEIKRNYNLKDEARTFQIIVIGDVKEDLVKDTPIVDGQELLIDTNPYDYLECVASEVPAPGRSMNSTGGLPPRNRLELQDCQSWIKQVIGKLVDRGVLSQEANRIVEKAPQH